jgi:uncharacterized membrane protein (UPF0127 family)
MSGGARFPWSPPLALLLAIACTGEPEPATPGYPTAEVTIGIHRTQVEVADTPERLSRGLSGRPGLAEGRGMVFPYARADRHGFWMYDMHFDIDIVWIRGERIVDVTPRVPHDPPGKLPVYRPRAPADLVLEVPAGTAEKLGWKIGDRVTVDPPVRPRGAVRVKPEAAHAE